MCMFDFVCVFKLNAKREKDIYVILKNIGPLVING
jgi:hypothetical protein